MLLEKKKEAEVKLLAQTEEIEKLKIEMKALKKENNELSFHLTLAEEDNTRLGLKKSKMHTEEYLETMVNYSWRCCSNSLTGSCL